jgi:hypothetical protein
MDDLDAADAYRDLASGLARVWTEPPEGGLMRDPHIPLRRPRYPGFGHPAMRALIMEATWLVPDLPKTVGTGCRWRRPIARTSSHAARALSCGTPRHPAADLRFKHWSTLAAIDRIRLSDGPTTAPAASRPPP